MKFQGLDRKIYSLNVKSLYSPLRTEAACKSKFQYQCGQIIKEKFPLSIILEELKLPGHNLVFDFFLPLEKLVFEIDGEQHEEYVPFFHGSKKGFIKARNRDDDKSRLCEINGWELIRIKSVEELREILNVR
jgi:hypothetical protein